MALKLLIETIPHNQQRYDTVGDWFKGPDSWDMFRISEQPTFEEEVAFAVHELVEWALCKKLGITETVVDLWDFKFIGEGEPGEAEDCPYRIPHLAANRVEALVKELFQESSIIESSAT